MAAPHTQRVTDRSAWTGDELARRTEEWVYRLSAAEVAELKAAAVRVKGRPLASLGRKDFDLPLLDRSLERIAREVDEGLGLQLIRGFPSAEVGEDVSAAALWAVSTRLGDVISQNA